MWSRFVQSDCLYCHGHLWIWFCVYRSRCVSIDKFISEMYEIKNLTPWKQNKQKYLDSYFCSCIFGTFLAHQMCAHVQNTCQVLKIFPDFRILYKSPFAAKFSWKKRSSHQGKKEVACIVSKPLVSCLWGCGESVNPPNLNLQEVYWSLSSRPKGYSGLLPIFQDFLLLSNHTPDNHVQYCYLVPVYEKKLCIQYVCPTTYSQVHFLITLHYVAH